MLERPFSKGPLMIGLEPVLCFEACIHGMATGMPLFLPFFASFRLGTVLGVGAEFFLLKFYQRIVEFINNL